MMKVGVIGTRGIPNKYGGFERFLELLVSEDIWLKENVHFNIYCGENSAEYNAWTSIKNIRITKDSHPFYYYIKSAWLASTQCDVILCCGVAISIFSILPRIHKKILIINPDGCEWRRTKWSFFGRAIIRCMYLPAFLFANKIVLDSESLREDFNLSLDKAVYIGYQAPLPKFYSLEEGVKKRYDLNNPFFLVIARLEPENNILTILNSFLKLNNNSIDLIIIGGIYTKHYKEILYKYNKNNIRFIGSIYDQNDLNQLRSNCMVYIHGHSVGGTNPSLLEALATVHGSIICHKNKYNMEVAGLESKYFSSEKELVDILIEISTSIDSLINQRKPKVDIRYSSQHIADKYLELFKS